MKIYVLGNPLLEEDNLPLKILPKLKGLFPEIDFLELDPTENFPEEDKIVLIDSVAKINEVVLIKDVEKITPPPNYSVHDFDLGFQLKLMKKLGKLKDLTIIGLPNNLSEKEALIKLRETISKLLSENG